MGFGTEVHIRQVVLGVEELLVHLDHGQEGCGGILGNLKSGAAPLLVGKLFRHSDHVEVVTGVVDGHCVEKSHEIVEGHPEAPIVCVSACNRTDVVFDTAGVRFTILDQVIYLLSHMRVSFPSRRIGPFTGVCVIMNI